MIALGNTTSTITATLSGAVSTNQVMCTVFFTDEPATTSGVAIAIHDKLQTLTNGATPVTICAAGPGGVGFRRRVEEMNIFNNDTAAITIAIKIVDTANATMTLQTVTLQTLEQLNYVQGYGFVALDVNGATKSQNANTSAAASTADSKAVLASSQTSSYIAVQQTPSSVASISVQASSMASLIPASVSSQASSMASQNPATVSSLQSAASVQSFTSTTWSTISSATSRVKSSFTW